jgi:flagellar basal body-associated protein FliL
LALVVLISVLASGFGLLMFVFVRKAWAGAHQDAVNAEKVARIKRLLGLARG